MTDEFEVHHREPDVWWYQAPKPRRWHRCRPWTWAYITSATYTITYVERCACGAIRDSRTGPWIERNSRSAS